MLLTSGEIYNSYSVTLILGEEETVVVEDAAFLAGFSEFFAILLFSNFAEAGSESLRLSVK